VPGVPWAQVAILHLLQALDFAAERHSAQRRKGPDAAPYVNHLIEVATLVANVGQVDDVEVLIAAVLHDVLEDTPTSADEVTERFGERVCRFVRALSDDKALPRKRRREITLEELPEMEALVKVIKLADLSSNIKLLPPNWSEDRKLEYLEWSERAATICSACPGDARGPRSDARRLKPSALWFVRARLPSHCQERARTSARRARTPLLATVRRRALLARATWGRNRSRTCWRRLENHRR